MPSVVDRVVRRACVGRVQDDLQDDERDDPDREVDVEDPAPREMVDEEPAEQRPDHRRDAEDGAHQARSSARARAARRRRRSPPACSPSARRRRAPGRRGRRSARSCSGSGRTAPSRRGRRRARPAARACARSMSPSFPASGVVIVDASRYAVTTHDSCAMPPRSPAIVGSAVETIVESSDASSITSISAPKIGPTRVRLRPPRTLSPCGEYRGTATPSARRPATGALRVAARDRFPRAVRADHARDPRRQREVQRPAAAAGRRAEAAILVAVRRGSRASPDRRQSR